MSRVVHAAEAAHRLGVSAKALRLYEQRGLLAPLRSAAGWRAYGPAELARGAEIVGLRGLGLSLAEVAHVLGGDARALAAALAAQQSRLEAQAQAAGLAVARVRQMRDALARGQAPGDLGPLLAPAWVEFALPWPWGGESFAWRADSRLTYIVGPLGSGKTRLAMRLAEAWPGAAFLGLERDAAGLADPALRARVDRALAWLAGDGASETPALLALLAGLEAEGPSMLVVDMIEQGLDAPTQQAVAAWLRARAAMSRPVFAMTRSCAMLDLAALGPAEAIILCPANHSPPHRVLPVPGAAGYEAVATCLASPAVRARVAGGRPCG